MEEVEAEKGDGQGAAEVREVEGVRDGKGVPVFEC